MNKTHKFRGEHQKKRHFGRAEICERDKLFGEEEKKYNFYFYFGRIFGDSESQKKKERRRSS